MWLRSGEFIRDALRRDVEAVPHSTDLNFLSRDTQIGRIFRSNSRIQVFLIVDGHPVHKAKMVRDYVAVESDWLELFFLPAYASTQSG